MTRTLFASLEQAILPRSLALTLALLASSVVPVAAEESALSPGLLNPLSSSLKASDLRAFRDRPLFAPSRQPPPPVRRADRPLPVSAPQKEPPKVQLTGVIQGIAAPVAILQRMDASATVTVRVGDELEGWRVASIEALSLLFRNGTREREYRLFAADSVPVASTDAPSNPNPKAEGRGRTAYPGLDIAKNILQKAP